MAMRTSNAATTSSTAARRAQPMRQTRTNPPRSSAKATGPFPPHRQAGDNVDSSRKARSPPGFFPAMTHFTDSITAVPREVIRHLAMLKEVDAKACGPEKSLSALAQTAMRIAPPLRNDADQAGGATVGQFAASSYPAPLKSLPDETLGDTATGAENQSNFKQIQSPEGGEDFARRQLFFHLRYVLTELLMTLDEKNHVISNATEALQKELQRCDSSFPYIENEISEEARYGSLSHWAYSEKVNGKSNGTSNERPRRDISASNALTAAVAALGEEGAASRSEIRREAMLARKSKTQMQTADSGPSNGHAGRKRDPTSVQPAATGGLAKKGTGNVKSRKAGDVAGSTFAGSVLNGSSAPDVHPNKRRKTEKSTQSRSVTEPTTLETGGGADQTIDARNANNKREAGSPVAAPVAEPARKRYRPSAATGNAKKRGGNPSAAPSPSLAASSPVNSTFTAPKDVAAGSPAPSLAQRPSTARGRQNSAPSINQEVAANGRARPSSSASNKLNNANGAPADPESAAPSVKRMPSEPKPSVKAASKPREVEPAVVEHKTAGGNAESKSGNPGQHPAKESSERPLRRENTDGDGAHAAPGVTVTSTRGGNKSSKTSTPVSATFPELNRSRSSRGGSGGGGGSETTTKRSHKKGAGSIATQNQRQQQQQPQQPQPAQLPTNAIVTTPTIAAAADPHRSPAPNEGENDNEEDLEDNEGGTEPRYCYCNQVSYGSMVACDAKDCAREWFHLSCVGLTKSPGKNEVWYCDACKENNIKKGKPISGTR